MHIAALGSSFAAGPNIPPQTSTAARRSGNNYASLLLRSLPENLPTDSTKSTTTDNVSPHKLTDLTSSGATLLNVLRDPQETLLATLPPQISLLPADVDVVTLTAGGNDLGYSAGMIADAARLTVEDEGLLGMMLEGMGLKKGEGEDGGEGGGSFVSGAVSKEEVAERFVQVIDAIKLRAPNARVFLVEYLAVFGRDSSLAPDQPLGEEKVAFYRALAGDLKDAYALAAERRRDVGVEVVRVADLSEKEHALGSPEPWVTGFTVEGLMGGGAPFHPNALGHRGVAEVLRGRVLGGLEGL